MSSTLSPVARFLLVVAAFVIVVAGMRAAESLLVPFLLSLFIAIIVSPLLAWLNARGVPNVVSILLVVSVIVIFGVAIGAVVGSSINSFRSDLPEYQQRLTLLSDNIQQALASIGLSIEPQQWRGVFNPGTALSMAGNTLASFGNLMTNSLLILLTVTFILAEEINFSEKLKASMTDGDKTISALANFTRSVNKYMAMKTIISLATGLLIMVSLMIIGVDYAVLWGMLAFLLNFIPTLGSLLAAIPTVILALVQLGIFHAVVTGFIYLVVNVLVGSIIEPRYMGKGLNISSLVVFLSLVFWGWVLGPVGMLLSVPLTITVKIALESFDDTRWLGVMLGSTPETEDGR